MENLANGWNQDGWPCQLIGWAEHKGERGFKIKVFHTDVCQIRWTNTFYLQRPWKSS